MPLSDVLPEKNKRLCDEWAESVSELDRAFKSVFGEIGEHIKLGIALTVPQSAIEVASSDELDELTARIRDFTNDERFSELTEAVKELLGRLKGVTDVAVKFGRGVSGDPEAVMAIVRREFPGLKMNQLREVEQRLYPAHGRAA